MCSLLARPYVTKEKDIYSFRVAQMPLFVRNPRIKSVKIDLNMAYGSFFKRQRRSAFDKQMTSVPRGKRRYHSCVPCTCVLKVHCIHTNDQAHGALQLRPCAQCAEYYRLLTNNLAHVLQTTTLLYCA